MKKRKIQIAVGLVVGLIVSLISAASKLYDEFPISILIVCYTVGSIAMCVIIYAFFNYYN